METWAFQKSRSQTAFGSSFPSLELRASYVLCTLLQWLLPWVCWAQELPWWLSGKEFASNAGAAGDVGSIPGLERFPGGGHDYPLQYSCLGNPMDRGAWQAIIHGVAKSLTQRKRLSMQACCWAQAVSVLTA